MTKLNISVMIFILSFALCSPAPAVNGYLEDVEGQKVLHVWGTHYEMGYAYGYLNGGGIQAMIEDYTIDQYLGQSMYLLIRAAAAAYIEIPSPFDEEFQGMIDGMAAAGVDMFIDFVDGMRMNPEAGRRKALDAIKPFARDRHATELLMEICVAIAVADGPAYPEEVSAMDAVSRSLGLPSGRHVSCIA